MKVDRMSINKIDIELSDYEAEELANILEIGMYQIEEFEVRGKFLKEHCADWWKTTINLLRLTIRYEL